jgi:type II secretory pathway predicted ATPase ExeA
MYEHHFALAYRPFPPAAAASCYVPVGTIEEARQTVARCVQRASGPAVVIGGAGTGKTMICEVLAEQFATQFCVAYLNNGRLPTPRALLQAILFEIGRPYRDLDENELRLSLADFLASDEGKAGLLLIIDEAHALPVRLLEEIRLLTNSATQGQSRIRLVLAGAPSLEERLASPKLESFHQRIAARAYLEHLTREETATFICEQLNGVGGNTETMFPLEAQRAVYDATDGIPRLVNQLCDHALIIASINHQPIVSAATVQEAWSDLQQLPTPWIEPVQKPGKAATAEVIEFGSLADDEDQGPASIPFPQRAEPAASQLASELLETAGYRGFVSDEQLDEIERQVAALDELEHDQEIAAWQPAEAATHPFTEAFDEEEVIVDDFASIEENYLAAAKRVASEEGLELGALLAGKALSPVGVGKPPMPAAAPMVALAHSETLGHREQQALTEAVAALLKQAGIPLPGEKGASARPAAQRNESPAAMASRDEAQLDVEGDDRDVIIIYEQEEATPDRPPARAKRQQYRQLFARLRQA